MEDDIVHIARTAGGILLLLDLWRAQVGERPVRALLPPITREHSHACWRSDQLVSANVDEDLQKQESKVRYGKSGVRHLGEMGGWEKTKED